MGKGGGEIVQLKDSWLNMLKTLSSAPSTA